MAEKPNTGTCLTGGGVKKRALVVDELPKHHGVGVNAEESLELLGRQNVGLNTDEWVIESSESRDTTRVVWQQVRTVM